MRSLKSDFCSYCHALLHLESHGNGARRDNYSTLGHHHIYDVDTGGSFCCRSTNLEDAARDAGATKFRVFRDITLRLAMPGILVAMVMSFLHAFDEAQGTYLVGVPTIYTMPTLMYALVLNYPAQIAAVFSILLTIPSVILIGIARKHILGGQLAEGFQIK